MENAKKYYPHTEGIVANNGHLYFVSKMFKMLYDLDLDDLTYRSHSVKSGLFDGAPDQIAQLFETTKKDADQSQQNLL